MGNSHAKIIKFRYKSAKKVQNSRETSKNGGAIRTQFGHNRTTILIEVSITVQLGHNFHKILPRTHCSPQ
ncbi:hypothetical protein KL930_002393 [Ogataea haglerorum]|uniref:Uncharacterized protein n=1 Tax=Ogataea haglerorum TaxID=1937702 RepID=A0AAN6HYL9_9ASCO|nr:uncharacterized protein KL911_000001 [Ogataea haglerorum]KAG7691326.1 hypothetical protein KL915_005377 [Ogataea haglerorum]KAG7709862.1 hypothetical protein KL914_000772 [Ogataea haglerorum]KAG7711358.1 hypothetical protein KL950_001324 [Ogataea haglerorum]KAG7712924.1 hypothetical protein KL949_005385 [Ogataea haglerorum]KAG7712942.1 hypothetical protein KL913_005394 [Ogataea haglerorum]